MIRFLKICIVLFLSTSLFTSPSFAAQKAVSASRAANYIGDTVLACGKLMEVKRTRTSIFLNLDAPYPHQSLTIYVKKSNYNEVFSELGSPNSHINKIVCALGEVKEYKKNVQIEVRKPKFISLAK